MITDGIAQYLGANIGALNYSAAAGGNVFVDALPASPDQCVSVFTTPGAPSDSKLPYDTTTVQIVIRSTASPAWALAMSQTIYSFLHAKRNVTLPDGTYLVWALFMQSASPNHIGVDSNGRHMYSMNVQCEIRNPTAERTSE